MSSTPGHGGSPRWGTETSTGPDELSTEPAIRASRFPRWALALGVVLLTLALAAAAGLAAWRINASRPDEVVVQAPGAQTPWAMVPPLRMGEYSRNANSADTPSPNPSNGKKVIAATYARNGVDSVVLLMSRPERDARKFLTDTGLSTVVATGDGFCGTTLDTNRDGCAVIRDDTAVMVVDLVGMSRGDLVELAEQFAGQVSR